MITFPLKQLWSHHFVKQNILRLVWLLSLSMESHKATTHVVAIIWTDDRTSVSQGAYSKCRSVAFMVQICIQCPQKTNENQKTGNIFKRNRHKKKQIRISVYVIQNTTAGERHNDVTTHTVVAIRLNSGTNSPCKAFCSYFGYVNVYTRNIFSFSFCFRLQAWENKTDLALSTL